MMNEDFIRFRISKDRDPDGSKLRALFEAHSRFDAFRVDRQRLTLIVAIISVPALFLRLYPNLVPAPWPKLFVTVWLFTAAATALTSVLELKWYRRRERRLSDLQ